MIYISKYTHNSDTGGFILWPLFSKQEYIYWNYVTFNTCKWKKKLPSHHTFYVDNKLSSLYLRLYPRNCYRTLKTQEENWNGSLIEVIRRFKGDYYKPLVIR